LTIVTPTYRPKRASRKKRKKPEIANRIVTPAPMKPRKGPVIRLKDQQQANDNSAADQQPQPKRSAIVEPKRRSRFGGGPELTEEEVLRRSDAAEALFREIVRRATGER
jgi:hypothetical protein